ncbi:hypothetical protein KDI_21930 [Dictyobacter arantiisoli]|uniref:Uncharacterized protein n=1 Tax=Dictyobacter arantiisoli TaxID=2014874 RepID=A0A5A5TC89_9CHLR|nr:hypothetical protein KDI_21930 [Dictyobacter arantiisoli]
MRADVATEVHFPVPRTTIYPTPPIPICIYGLTGSGDRVALSMPSSRVRRRGMGESSIQRKSRARPVVLIKSVAGRPIHCPRKPLSSA